jgi:hypothetical protein
VDEHEEREEGKERLMGAADGDEERKPLWELARERKEGNPDQSCGDATEELTLGSELGEMGHRG